MCEQGSNMRSGVSVLMLQLLEDSHSGNMDCTNWKGYREQGSTVPTGVSNHGENTQERTDGAQEFTSGGREPGRCPTLPHSWSFHPERHPQGCGKEANQSLESHQITGLQEK